MPATDAKIERAALYHNPRQLERNGNVVSEWDVKTGALRDAFTGSPRTGRGALMNGPKFRGMSQINDPLRQDSSHARDRQAGPRGKGELMSAHPPR